jgi:FKBP-type peptidyl-prolyl cis-trans isomerase
MKRAILILACSLLAACHNDPPMVGRPTTQSKDLKEHLINANRTIAQSEETAIDEYVTRRGWQMEKLPEGARLWEYRKGINKKIEIEDSVHLRYNIEAINGKTIYNDIEDNYVAGRRQEMIGLDYAVLQLHRGSRAKVILPSNLAYGIGGDGDRIPQSAILVIDLEVL